MNTQFIYISNIPSNCKPVLLLHELKNKWARMLYLENTFSGGRDAFVYNPTDNYEHFCNGVQNLRNKDFEGAQSLSVYFVWFPPANVFITTMIPMGASMLSYLFVENLHKDVIPTDVMYDLPLQMSDIKNWNIPERQDKCFIIKLPQSCNAAMRSFILGTLRSRPVRGNFIRVSELIISEENQLCSQLVPRSVKITESKKESYPSNFFYLHDIPSNLTVKMLIETAKTDNIRGVRIFFVETKDNKKYGFMYVPRSLPSVRFMALHEKIRCQEFQLTESEIGRVKIERTWFQPHEAEIPVEEDGEMILTEYVYLYGVPPGMLPAQLIIGSPVTVKLYLFTVNEMSNQIGFVVLRGLSEQECACVMEYLRNINFNGIRIQVEEVYLHCHSLPGDTKLRPFQLQPRKRTIVQETVKRCHTDEMVTTSNGYSNDLLLSCGTVHENTLMKTEFLCVDNLPNNVSKAALIFDIGRPSDGCIVIPYNDRSTAFIYFPGCDKDTWMNIIRKLSIKSYSMHQSAQMYEVYLKTEFSSRESEMFMDTNVIFVYNIASDVEIKEINDLGTRMIQYVELLETTSGSKSAFVLLRDGCTSENKLLFLYNIRKKFLRNKPIYADLIKLAPVGLQSDAQESKKYRFE